jgi:hypothetical protein
MSKTVISASMPCRYPVAVQPRRTSGHRCPRVRAFSPVPGVNWQYGRRDHRDLANRSFPAERLPAGVVSLAARQWIKSHKWVGSARPHNSPAKPISESPVSISEMSAGRAAERARIACADSAGLPGGIALGGDMDARRVHSAGRIKHRQCGERWTTIRTLETGVPRLWQWTALMSRGE